MTLRNPENVEVKLNGRQVFIYIAGIIMATVTVFGAYLGISNKLDQMAGDNSNLRNDIKNIQLRMDAHQSQSEVRYLEIKLDLEKKQDKKP